MRSSKTQVKDTLGEVRPQVENALDTARDVVEDLIGSVEQFLEGTAKPAVTDAAGRARETARTLATEKAAPLVATGAAKAAERAQQVHTKADAIASAPRRRRRRKIRLALLALLGGAVAAAVVRKKMMGPTDTWQSAYQPTTDDRGGASPDEALADATDSVTYPTTPDRPADVVDFPEGEHRPGV